jgi:hypothetical protein
MIESNQAPFLIDERCRISHVTTSAAANHLYFFVERRSMILPDYEAGKWKMMS